MKYSVKLSREAEADLERLFDFILDRELSLEGGDLELAARAVEAIRAGIATLRTSPFTCRKAGDDSFRRELVIPFGHTGYVALFEIVRDDLVLVGAVRHQREDDYH